MPVNLSISHLSSPHDVDIADRNSTKETAALPTWNHHILATRHVPPAGDEDRSLALVLGATKALHTPDPIDKQIVKIDLVADDI